MPSYVIGYDLNKEGKNYAAKNKKLTDNIIKKFPTYWHNLDSTWIVVSNLTCEQIRDALIIDLDKNDELLVVKCSGDGAWIGFNDAAGNWLRQNL